MRRRRPSHGGITDVSIMSTDSVDKTKQQPDTPSSGEFRSAEDSSVDYFDRERWHDVEDEAVDDDMNQANESLFSNYSTAILLLVTVLAAALGLGLAYYTHRMARFAAEPIAKDRPDYSFIPPQRIGYAQDGAVSFPDIEDPGCFAASSDGSFFIGSDSKPTLVQYSLSGLLLKTFTLEDIPTAVLFGSEEQLFPGKIVVAHRNRFVVYDMDGKKSVEWPSFNDKADVRFFDMTENAVFAADSANKVVWRLDSKGKVVRKIGQADVANTDDENSFAGFVVFKSPISLTISRKTGILYVANPGRHHIEAFTLDGHYEPSLSWGHASTELAGFAGCCNPVQIIALPDGRMLTAEKSKNNMRVKVYLANGLLDWIVAGPEILTFPPSNIANPDYFRSAIADSDRPLGVAALPNNKILVYDPILRLVRVFLPTTERKKELPTD